MFTVFYLCLFNVLNKGGECLREGRELQCSGLKYLAEQVMEHSDLLTKQRKRSVVRVNELSKNKLDSST